MPCHCQLHYHYDMHYAYIYNSCCDTDMLCSVSFVINIMTCIMYMYTILFLLWHRHNYVTVSFIVIMTCIMYTILFLLWHRHNYALSASLSLVVHPRQVPAIECVQIVGEPQGTSGQWRLYLNCSLVYGAFRQFWSVEAFLGVSKWQVFFLGICACVYASYM